MRLHIHIERLTAEGLTAADAQRLGEAVQRHMTRLVHAAAEPLSPAARRVDRLDGAVPHGASLVDIGRHLATQIFRELTGPGRA
jgi:hypothetical protein